ncbi:tetraspanin-33 isoform X1 [Oenanthe melanoleuca]|uniref:tetraspanin-33 isoform X1 n=1 Tax=Oenanthe melanoleuca TaxID=2939378 RepID=UPI0024C12D5E|nr:tetraspanin-33 isoform X1 [Oenanthe melanoleuca]
MARRVAAAAGPLGDDFSFVSPVAKYVLFFFNLLFWVISMVMVAVGVYARLLKHAEAAMACLAVDPAILLIMVGVLTFLITFCGCVGSLRENICLLQLFSVCLTIIFLLQLVVGVLGFVFSDEARGKVSEIINGAIVHYRDDLDLQNLIDFGQKEPPTPAVSAAPCPSPAACTTLSRPSSTPCVATGCRPGATWRPVPSSTPTAASTSWSTGPTATCSCWGASPWGWPCPSWWASSWLSSSSTKSATRSSCSSTTSSTVQTPGTEPGCPGAFPDPGSETLTHWLQPAGRAPGLRWKRGNAEAPVLGSAWRC